MLKVRYMQYCAGFFSRTFVLFNVLPAGNVLLAIYIRVVTLVFVGFSVYTCVG
jgi:hypothetical protein